MGLFDAAPISRWAFVQRRDNSEGKRGQRFVQSFRWLDGTPLEVVRYDAVNEKLAIWAAENCDGLTLFGVFIFISPSPRAWQPDAACRAMFFRHRIISVSGP
jgi:hypothetical protein